MMRSTAAIVFAAAILVSLLQLCFGVVDAATQKPLLNATHPFWQLNRTTFVNANVTLANWANLPAWGRIHHVDFDASTRRYLFFTDMMANSSVLYSASEDDLILGSESKNFKNMFVAHHAPFLSSGGGTAYGWVTASLGPYQCINKYFTPENCASLTQPGASATLFFAPQNNIFAACSFKPTTAADSAAAAPELYCPSGKVTSKMPLAAWSMTVSAAPRVRPSDQSPILLASVTGLFSLQSMSNSGGVDLTASQVQIYNTTGSIVPLGRFSNVTYVSCMPRAYYTMMSKPQQQAEQRKILSRLAPSGGKLRRDFFGADCFAATSENYCTSNVCPADLVHLLSAKPAPGAAPVVERATPLPFMRTPSNFDSLPTASVYTPFSKDVYFGNAVNVNEMHHTGSMRRWGGFNSVGTSGGLPHGNVLSGAWLNLTGVAARMMQLGVSPAEVPETLVDGAVFFGTRRGAIARLPKMSAEDDDESKNFHRWKLLLGGRWLPGGNDAGLTKGMDVYKMAGSSPGAGGPEGGKSVLAVTSTGISVFHAVTWRPSDKAKMFEDTVAPLNEHRDGLFFNRKLARWGDPSSATYTNSANSGLWTGMRIVEEAMRYYVTGSEEARANCWKAFSGLELLINVTGTRGLMARDATLATNNPSGTQWVHSTAMPGWVFWPSASSDEVTGHMAGRAALYELVAQTDEERARIVKSASAIMEHIVNHNLTLIDYNGKPTHWGHWGPQALFADPYWYDDHLNAIEIMGWLAWTHKVTQNETFARVFDTLRDDWGYGEMMVNAKINQPGDINYSDDELGFFAMVTMFFSALPSKSTGKVSPLFLSVAANLEEGLFRWWKSIKGGRPSYWAALTWLFWPTFDAAHNNRQRHLAEYDSVRLAVQENIYTFPLDHNINWPVDNSKRHGLTWNPHNARNGQAHVALLDLFPLDEIDATCLWNGDPFRATSGGGTTVNYAWAYTGPYWAALMADKFNN